MFRRTNDRSSYEEAGRHSCRHVELDTPPQKRQEVNAALHFKDRLKYARRGQRHANYGRRIGRPAGRRRVRVRACMAGDRPAALAEDPGVVYDRAAA